MKKLVYTLLLSSFTAGIFIILHSANTTASPNYNRLMDDAVFNNTQTMSDAQIDGWLNSHFPKSCISTNNGFKTPDPIGYSPSTGFKYGSNVSAGRAIHDAAHAYDINPQVIIATLQKESSVVSGTASYGCQYIKTAMGYDCPDSGSCPQNPATESGFSKQIIWAAWSLKHGQQRSEGNVGWMIMRPGWDNSDEPQCYSSFMTEGYRKRCTTDSQATYYDGRATIDGTSVHMDTGATAALYRYTPHKSGNSNFVSIFTNWFGPTLVDVVYAQANNGSATQYVIYSGYKQAITSPSVIRAWGISNLPLQYYDPTALSLIPNITTPLTRVVKNSSGHAYFIDSDKYYSVSNNDLEIWGNFNNQAVSTVTSKLFALVSYAGTLQPFVKSSDNATTYMVDKGTLHPIAGPDILKDWGTNSVRPVQLSSEYMSTMATGSVLDNPEFTYGGIKYILSSGTAMSVSANISSLLPSWTPLAISGGLNSRFSKGSALEYLIRARGTSTIYLLEGGVKHPIQGGDVFNAFRASSVVVQSDVSSSLANTIPLGSAINSTIIKIGSSYYVVSNGLYPIPPSLLNTYNVSSTAITLTGNLTNLFKTIHNATPFAQTTAGGVYFLDNGKKRPIGTYALFLLLGGRGKQITLPNGSLSLFPAASSMSPYIANGSASYLIDSGQSFTVPSASVASSWGLTSALSVNAETTAYFSGKGVLSQHIQLPDGFFGLVDSGHYYRAEQRQILHMWGVSSEATHPTNSLLSYLHISRKGALTRFAIGRSGGVYSHTVFTVAQGKLWGVVNPNNLRNLGYDGSLVALSDSTISSMFQSTVWQGYLATDDTGNLWVLDGGTRRAVTSSYDKGYWRDGAGLPAPTPLGSEYLSLLPRATNMTKSIKYTTNTIYGMKDGEKCGITTPAKYISLGYVPYTFVSSSLFNSIKTGSSI